jgi:hypothetical protein
MALYTLVVRRSWPTKINGFTMQLVAASASDAADEFFARIQPTTREPDEPLMGSGDIHAFLPIDGLVNVWLIQAGKGGKYLSIVCSRTDARQGS